MPYEYVLVDNHNDLAQVLKIAGATIEHDRYSRDPKIGKQISGDRYQRYLLDSFQREDDQIWSVRSKATKEILTFRSHRSVNEKEVNLLIGGVHPDHKSVGLGVVSSYFCFNQLRSMGYKRATTHISAANIPIINLEVNHLNFRVTDTFVVLRKVIN
jgi:hypothetical protein